MKRTDLTILAFFSGSVFTILTISGCNPSTSPNSSPSTTQKDAADHSASHSHDHDEDHKHSSDSSSEMEPEHTHENGAHGGMIISLGRDSYHIEAVVSSDGSLRLYTLGNDETRIAEVESQTLNGFVKAAGDTDSQSIVFEPSPQEGDSEGKTSLFVGTLPKELLGQKLEVTIPNIRIAGERFRLGFSTGEESQEHVDGMPEKAADSDDDGLYLTPGGRYTAADIAVNGAMTAAEKFKGIKSTHDIKPQAGDRLCPITETKANPSFTWIIDGKAYEFCCPPCVDEFLKMAKSTDEPLPSPDTFIKK